MSARPSNRRPDALSPDQTRLLAEQWFDRQVTTLRLCHGPRWPDHQVWVEEYLRGQLRQRLIEAGWRLKR